MSVEGQVSRASPRFHQGSPGSPPNLAARLGREKQNKKSQLSKLPAFYGHIIYILCWEADVFGSWETGSQKRAPWAAQTSGGSIPAGQWKTEHSWPPRGWSRLHCTAPGSYNWSLCLPRCWGMCKWTNVEVQREFNGIQGRSHAWVQRRQSRGGEEAAQHAARWKGGREENRAAGNKFFRASSTGKYIFVKDFYTLCFSKEIKITSQQLGAQLNFECYCRTEGKGP